MASRITGEDILPVLLDLRRRHAAGGCSLYVAWREAIIRGMGWSVEEFERRMERARESRNS